ncbi:MAG: class I SAM-dependent methyltransferase [bacterium]
MQVGNRKTMLMNWPERLFIYSPLRILMQHRQAGRWLGIAGSVRPPARTLEIGCGLGKGARICVDRLGARRVIAFDLEEKLVLRAARKLPAAYSGRISFLASDAQDLPFRDSDFDAVIDYGIIHHVLDWRRCMSEISRVLRSDGLFYFEEIYPLVYANPLMRRLVRHPEADRFDGPRFLAALAASGLSLLEGVRIGSPFGIVGVARKMERRAAGDPETPSDRN